MKTEKCFIEGKLEATESHLKDMRTTSTKNIYETKEILSEKEAKIRLEIFEMIGEKFLKSSDVETLNVLEKIQKEVLGSFYHNRLSLIKVMKSLVDELEEEKCDERKVKVFGEYEARTYEDKEMVNAVIQLAIDKINNFINKIK